MIPKIKEKEEAVKLRTEGFSIKKIAKILDISVGSAYNWTKNVKLTEDQKYYLNKRFYTNKDKNIEKINIEDRTKKQKTGLNKKQYGDYKKKYYLNIRSLAQEKGRILALNKDPDFIAGIMLFWAEGSKRRSSVVFTNSDINMLKIFKNFLVKFFNVDTTKISFFIRWFSDNGLGYTEIKKYWLEGLNLPESCLRKDSCDIKGKFNSCSKKGRLIYGVGRLQVHSVEIIQAIYGAIQEYAGFKDDKFLSYAY